MALIRPLFFFGALGAGLLFCYLSSPPPHVVVKFPTPYNADSTVYKDESNTCYKYAAEQVACPADKSLIKAQPLTTT